MDDAGTVGGKCDFVEDVCDAAFEQIFDALAAKGAIGSVGDTVIEDDAISRSMQNVYDGKDFAFKAENLIAILGFHDVHMGIIVEEQSAFGFAIESRRFHGASETIFPDIAAATFGASGKPAWKPKIDASAVSKVIGKEEFLEAENVIAMQM